MSDSNALHIQEMQNAADAAKAEYLESHPEAVGTEMKFDPLLHIDRRGGVQTLIDALEVSPFIYICFKPKHRNEIKNKNLTF